MDEVGSFFFRSDIWSQLSWGSMVRVANYRKSSKRGRDHMSVVFQEASQLNRMEYMLISIFDIWGFQRLSPDFQGSHGVQNATKNDE